ncbi:MAG: hypothetical protein JWO30_4480 [Fibrobacteres bacterium]|nr:hypothetical protein [Fibrobacterota bacterium]
MRNVRFTARLGFLILSGLNLGQAQFRHPGIFNSQEELDFIRQKTAASAAHPMKDGLKKLQQFYGAGLGYQSKPVATVDAVPSGVDASEQNFRDAGHAAYAQALEWVATGDVRYRDKGLEILNGWAKTMKTFTTQSNHQEYLEAAWALPTWCAAAEIFRYYNKGAAGWAKADIDQFIVLLNLLADDAVKTITALDRNNNWGSSSALSMMAVGVFEDDTAKFNVGLKFAIKILPAQVEKSGMIMETCRDCNHAEYNILGMMELAEVAWQQGIDFYGIKLDGQDTPRLLMGMEFHAAALLGKPLNVGQSCGPVNCSGEDKHAGGWEIGLNHYRYRAKLPVPNTTSFVTGQNRPDGNSEDHFTEWTTLTHAELGSIAYTGVGVRNNLGMSPAGPGLILQRNDDGLTLRYRLSGEARNGGPSRLEMFSTQGRMVFSSLLDADEGDLRIPGGTASGFGAGPYLFRVVPLGAGSNPLPVSK